MTERDCTGGSSADGRVDEPRISYPPEAVVVTFSVEPNPSHDCRDNPPTPYTVELSEPLGDRKLKDRLSYPPRDVEVSTNGSTTSPTP